MGGILHRGQGTSLAGGGVSSADDPNRIDTGRPETSPDSLQLTYPDFLALMGARTRVAAGLHHGDLSPLADYLENLSPDDKLPVPLTRMITGMIRGEPEWTGYAIVTKRIVGGGRPKKPPVRANFEAWVAQKAFEEAGGWEKGGWKNGRRVGRKAGVYAAAKASGLTERQVRGLIPEFIKSVALQNRIRLLDQWCERRGVPAEMQAKLFDRLLKRAARS